jgi:hypothetical protein
LIHVCTVCAAALAGINCGKNPPTDATDANKIRVAGADHAHTAPQGGTLVELGDHFACLEIVHDRGEGALTAYVLDAHAKNPIRLDARAIQLDVIVRAREGGRDIAGAGNAPVVHRLELAAMANALTGETIGDTSQFGVRAEELKGVLKFRGKISRVDVRGIAFEILSFSYPGGVE